MHTLIALVVAAFTAGVIAHPPGMPQVADVSSSHILRNGPRAVEPPKLKTIRDFLFPRYLRSQFVTGDERTRISYPRPQMPPSDWLNEEITRISGMQEPPEVPFKQEDPLMRSESFKRIIFGAAGPYRSRSRVPNRDYPLHPSKKQITAPAIPYRHPKIFRYLEITTKDSADTEAQDKKILFAFTPTDPGYFELTENTTNNMTANYQEGPHEGGGREDVEDMERRRTRQNPISRTKTLVTDDLAKLKAGVGSDADSKGKQQDVQVLGNELTTETIYIVGIAAGVSTAIILAILGFIFGWYSLSKRAKAAADVDYPAYGVTGPTMDTSGDRKLAHSAQMYHYQHQKQQIIAMERTNVEQCNGTVTDPESEEENEEGDYTVYECPGFATTGEMEVKNPLFNEEPTPATPGSVEVVKPQLKE